MKFISILMLFALNECHTVELIEGMRVFEEIQYYSFAKSFPMHRYILYTI